MGWYGLAGLFYLGLAEMDRAEGSTWYRIKAWFWTAVAMVNFAVMIRLGMG